MQMVEVDEFGPEKILEVFDHKVTRHGFVVNSLEIPESMKRLKN